MMELTVRFLQGRHNLEFYFRESLVSEQPDAIDLVHIPTGFVCLYDDETNSIDLSTWYEEYARQEPDGGSQNPGGTVMAA
jgi:hypothetical protein